MANSNLVWRNKKGDIRAIWAVLILLATVGVIANPLVILLDATEIPLLENSMKNICVAISVLIAIWIVSRLSIYRAADFGWRISGGTWGVGLMGIAAGAVPIYLLVVGGWGAGIFSVQDKPGTLFTNVSVSVSLLGQAARYLGGSLFEESVCRGFLFYLVLTRIPLQRTWQRNLLALVVSSALFSLLHFGNSQLTVFAYINLLLVGLWLGVLYLRTGNLFAPIAAHFSWNFFQNNIFGMPNGGGESKAWLLLVQPQVDNLLTGGDLGPEGSIIITLLLTMFVLAMLPWTLNRELIALRSASDDSGSLA